ncbi:MAG: hypothetical protein EA407_02945 [Rhodobacteraceae bacterium]|nr:MAG: hypothetical protein EA407_02945 [Paracoccaceae bacterium]
MIVVMKAQAPDNERIARVFCCGVGRDAVASAPVPARPKPRSHDDGPDCGPFHGGLGGPNFARNLRGHFDRWQLEPGRHGTQRIDAAFLMLRWQEENGRRGYRRLNIGPEGFKAQHRRVAALFPFLIEEYTDPDLPLVVTLTAFSPIIPGDTPLAHWPVTLFDVTLTPRAGAGRLTAAVGMIWPNLLGWHLPELTPARRGAHLWPDQSHSGQIHHAAPDYPGMIGVVQTHAPELDLPPPNPAGEVALLAAGIDWDLERAVSFKADQNALGRPDAEQKFTLAHVEAAFASGAGWEGYDRSWSAHWHEPLAAAVAGRCVLDSTRHLCFCLAMDIPQVRFGMGRRWWRAYCATWGREGNQASAMAKAAVQEADSWLGRIDAWHTSMLRALGADAGSMINALGFLSGGGAASLAGPVHAPREPKPLSGPAHFALLEGIDSGYYYYSTLDLWVYAFPALSLTFPDLAEAVFRDFRDSISATDATERPIYRDQRFAPILVPGKLPHDLGCPAEDPFIRLNGYVMRDDPNLWKDHNPAFIIAHALHRHLTGTHSDTAEFDLLCAAAEFTITQDREGTGVPPHDAFGDSTWDNLQFRGHSCYGAGLCLAAWAALARDAHRLGRDADAQRFAELVEHAKQAMAGLWCRKGGFFRTASEGKYRNATQSDALLGPLYARLAGLGDLIDPSRARQHLRATFARNFDTDAQRAVGPLLVADPAIIRYAQDGGEELQVNEVIVGSAHIFATCLKVWGLEAEYRAMREAITRHEARAGLQFRTPAAWDAEGQFRAPLNMRPMAIWASAIATSAARESAA